MGLLSKKTLLLLMCLRRMAWMMGLFVLGCRFVGIGYAQEATEEEWTEEIGEEEEEALTEDEGSGARYASILKHVHHLPYDEVVRQFEEASGSSLEIENQELMTSTLEQISKNSFSKQVYRLYFQSIEQATRSPYLGSNGMTSLLEVLRESTTKYTQASYLSLLRFLLFFLEEGVLYRSPSHSVYVSDSTQVAFGFEEGAHAAPSLLEVAAEAAQKADQIATATSSPPISTSSATPEGDAWGDSSGGGDDWGSSGDDWGDSGDDWGSSGDNWGAQDESSDPSAYASISDWGATSSGATSSWGATRSRYEQKASAFNRDELYAQIGVSLEPMPLFGGGAVVKIERGALNYFTSEDSLSIEVEEGVCSILGKQLRASSARMPWPSRGGQLEDAEVRCVALEAHLPTGRMQAEQAYLRAPQYVSDQEIEGLFEVFTQSNRLYPTFRSIGSEFAVSLPYDGAVYRGGLSLRDSLLYGASAGHRPGVLEIGSDSVAYVQASAEEFLFSSRIEARSSALRIFHGSDSLFHPHVELRYDPDSLRFFAIRHAPYLHTPYFSSCLGMYMQVDALDWDMSTDSLSVYIMEAQKNLAAFFESDAYFSEERFTNIRSFFRFHPLLAIVRFAKESNQDSFLSSDVSGAYKIDHHKLEACLDYLDQQRYVDYERRIGVVTVREKGVRWVAAALGYIDYDRLLISSTVDGGANGSFNLSKGAMKVNGIGEIYFTPDLKVYAKPTSGSVELKRGKNFSFDGLLNSGTIYYEGRDFHFDYDGYKIEMNQIDSMTFQIEEPLDSLSSMGEAGLLRKKEGVVNGVLNETEGILLIAPPSNRSGRKEMPSYPRFDSKNNSDVYFDDPRVLGGVYDRSVRFVAPPFEVDSINSLDLSVVGLEGTFYAGPIMGPFRQKLSIMADKSLGFTHRIEDPVGYPLYGLSDTYMHGVMTMDLNGMRNKGKIEYQTTTLYSDAFTLYPNKVRAKVREGHVLPGNLTGSSTSYPKIDFEYVKLLWQPAKDNMLLKSSGVPMTLYDSIGSFEGTLNIKQSGAFASGDLRMKIVEASSDYFQFRADDWKGRQVNLEVKSDDPAMPAIRGKRIELRYDLEEQRGHMKPERAGVPSIDFPYVKMKTSLYEAVWDYRAERVEMRRPDYVPLSKSFFTSTKPEMEELTFEAESAVYAMDSSQLRAEGVPYVRVLGVDIVPRANRLFVRANSEIDQLQDAVLYIDSESKMHTLVKGNIKIHSRNRFTGTAEYRYTNADADTFYIRFNEFLLEEVRGDDRKKAEVVIAEGVVPDLQHFKASAGFLFKGKVKMMANRKSLSFDGFVKLVLEGDDRNMQWIAYTSDEKDKEIVIDFDKAKTEDGTPLSAGLHYNQSGELYLTFMEDKQDPEDVDVFEPEGLLSYDTERNFYVVQEASSKQKKEQMSREEADEQSEATPPRKGTKQGNYAYTPKTFMYSPRTDNILVDGVVHLMGKDKHLEMIYGARGKANLKDKVYELEGLLSFDADLPTSVVQMLSDQIGAVGDYLELKKAVFPSDFLSLLAFLVGQRSSEEFAEEQRTPLYEVSRKLRTDIVFSFVALHWDAVRKSWYSRGDLHISNIQQSDVRVATTGYLSVHPQRTGADVHLLLYFGPKVWYYLRYQDQNLSLYSGVSEFNELVAKEADKDDPVPGSYSFHLGRSSEVELFTEDFSSHYLEGNVVEMEYPTPITSDNLHISNSDEYLDPDNPPETLLEDEDQGEEPVSNDESIEVIEDIVEEPSEE